MQKLSTWCAHLLPHTIIYACALAGVMLCLQISFPLPRAELQVGQSLDLVPPHEATDAELRERASAESRSALSSSFLFQTEDSSAPLAVLVELTAPTATLLLNGNEIQTIHGHRSVGAPGSIFVLVQLPKALTNNASNRLDFELKKVGPDDRVTIWRVFVGPYEELQKSYSQLRFLTQTIPALNFSWRLLFAVMLLGVFLARRQEVKYLLLALTLLVGAPSMLRLSGATLLLPEVLKPYAGIVAFWQTALLAMFSYSVYANRVAKPVYLFLTGAAIVSILTVMWPQTRLVAQAGPIFALACLWFAAAFSAMSIWKRGHIEDHIMFCNFAAIAVIGMVEIQDFLNSDASARLFRINILALFILMILSALMISRLIASLNAVDGFNTHLTSELKRTQDELHEAFGREQAILQVTALQRERERLMRDLHDGVSGRIVSTMALCELKGGEHREIGEALRDVLQDLRLVVASLEDIGGDLQQVFLTFRDQSDLPLRRLGLKLNCLVPELPAITNWMPSQSLQVYRILQECVSNAAKHSGCKEIDLSVSMIYRDPAASVRVMISDQGRGGATDRDGSYGLQNMRNRAATLGGQLEIQSGPTGTRVQLEIPVKLAQPVPPNALTRNAEADQRSISEPNPV